jgi:NADPH-dependent curcumin reductase CurA
LKAEGNRAWVLESRPQEKVAVSDFAFREDVGPPPDLEEGEILVRNQVFSCAPTIRNWLNDAGKSYRGAIGIGDPIRGLTGARVLVSRHGGYAPGDTVTAISPWQDLAVLAPDIAPVPVTKMRGGMSLIDAMSLYSSNSLTAFAGLVEVAKVKPGEVVLISGAAGSVGTVACQVARNIGCRVIGIAGGQDKCAWLREALGIDAVDYKAGDLRQQIKALIAGRVDVFFDNVGGDALEAAVDLMAPFGRVAVSGQISAYDGSQIARGPDMMKLVYGRLAMQGFLVGDYAAQYEAMWQRLTAWAAEGRLQIRVDRREGFANLPLAFVDLFNGRNAGTLLVDVSAD